MKQSDHIGNEGEVIGLDLPIPDYFTANDSDTLMFEGNAKEKKQCIHEFTKLYNSDSFEQQSSTRTELSVMWYYTSQFNSVTSDPALYISGLINNANAAYANSNINLRLKTKCVEQLTDNFVEGDSAGKLLEELVNVKGNLKAI